MGPDIYHSGKDVGTMQYEGLDTMTVGAIQAAFDELRRERDEARDHAHEQAKLITDLERLAIKREKELDLVREQFDIMRVTLAKILTARHDSRQWTHSDRDAIDQLMLGILRDTANEPIRSFVESVDDIPF